MNVLEVDSDSLDCGLDSWSGRADHESESRDLSMSEEEDGTFESSMHGQESDQDQDQDQVIFTHKNRYKNKYTHVVLVDRLMSDSLIQDQTHDEFSTQDQIQDQIRDQIRESSLLSNSLLVSTRATQNISARSRIKEGKIRERILQS